MKALATLVWLAIVATTPAAPVQDAWLKGFEGTWVVDGARGADAAIVLNIVREGNVLVLKTVLGGREIQTRYDVSGAEVTNANFGQKTLFRTRMDKQKMVTETWANEASGPPQTIETRYLESADVMVTELSKVPGGPPFNRTVMRRKPK